MRLNATSIRVIDLITTLVWVLALGLLATTTVLFHSSTALDPAGRDLMAIWTIAAFISAVGVSIYSAVSWVVRQFEDSLHIAENVATIHTELADIRDRRQQRATR